MLACYLTSTLLGKSKLDRGRPCSLKGNLSERNKKNLDETTNVRKELADDITGTKVQESEAPFHVRKGMKTKSDRKGLTTVAFQVGIICILISITLAAPVHLANTGSAVLLLLAPFGLRNPSQFMTAFCVAVLCLATLSVSSAESQFGVPDYGPFKPSGMASSMITENLADDNTHFLVFDHVGQMAATTTYYHVMLNLNFTAVTERILQVNQSMYKFWYAKHHYKAHSYYVEESLIAQTEHNLKQLSNRMQKLLDLVENLKDMLPEVNTRYRNARETEGDLLPPPPPPDNKDDSFLPVDHPHLARHKRWIFAAIVGVVGTLWGLYSAYQIHQIASNLQGVSETQNLLVHLTREDSKAINSLSLWLSGTSQALMSFAHINPQIIYIHFVEKVLELEQTVTKMVNIVQQLQHRRLSVDWLSKPILLDLQKSIDEKTKADKYLPLITHHSDFFQLELSYMRTPEGIVALLHVPCTLSETVLTIYKYVPFPIPLPHPTNHSEMSVVQAVHPDITMESQLTTNDFMNKTEALYLVAESDMIAIDDYGKYRLVTQSDLAACIQRNHVYLCDKLHIVKTKLGETCIGSLFMKNKGGVRQNCKFEKRPLREVVFPLTDNNFLVFTPEPYVSHARCRNGTSFRAEFTKATKVNVPDGCTLTLNSHEVSMAEKLYIPSPAFVTEWKWDPLTLPADLLADFPLLNSAIENITSQLNHHSLTSIHNQTVVQAQLADSLLKIDTISQQIDKVQKKSKLSDNGFLNYIDNNFLFSGSTSSIILWIVVALVIILCFCLALFYYRQKLTKKLLRSYDAAMPMRNVASAPPMFHQNQLYPAVP